MPFSLKLDKKREGCFQYQMIARLVERKKSLCSEHVGIGEFFVYTGSGRFISKEKLEEEIVGFTKENQKI